MSTYKRRIYASSILVLFLLLFITAGYYFISKKSLYQDHIKQALTLLHKMESQSFLISDQLHSLSIHSKLNPVINREHIDQIEVAVHSMKTSLNNFYEIRNNEDSLFKEGGSALQKTFNNYFSQVEMIVSNSQNGFFTGEDFNIHFVSAELDLRKNFAGVSNLLVVEKDHAERRKNLMKAVILGTLMMSLIVTLLLVTPLVRLSYKANKKMEKALSETKNATDLLRRVIDTSPDLIFILDNQHKYRMVNKTLAHAVKLSPGDFIGKDDMELGIFKKKGENGNDLEIKKRNENETVFKFGEIINIPEEPLIINEEKRIHSTIKVPLTNAKGNIWGLLGRSQDITDRINAERLINDSERKYRQLFIENPLPMWIMDTVTLNFLEVNKEAMNLYGYSEREFMSLSIFDIIPEEEKDRVVQIVNHIASGHNSFKKRKTCNHIKKNGENIFVDVDAQLFDFNNRQAFLFSAKDVTGAIKLQEQIVNEKVSHQKEITKIVISTQEKERAEIAKELHDNVNQILTSAKLHIECITSDSVEIHRKTSIDLIKSGIREIRKLSNSIISPSLNQVGLIYSINELLNNIQLTNFARIEFKHQTFIESSIESDLELTIYRIIQEQTTNILKYAEATIIRVELGQHENFLQLIITDNGVGFDTTTSSKGVGFTNMMNRAQIHHGDFRLISSPGNGCTLCINFRLNMIQQRTPLLHSA